MRSQSIEERSLTHENDGFIATVVNFQPCMFIGGYLRPRRVVEISSGAWEDQLSISRT